jgi:hypothetical protein
MYSGPGFVVVDFTEHGLTYVAPPSLPGRNPSGRHDYVAASQCVLATSKDGEIVAPFSWERNGGADWLALRRTQLATRTVFDTIAPQLGLRPGAHIVEASPMYGDPDVGRPIAADPGGDLRRVGDLDWHDARTAYRLRLSVDPNDEVDGATIVSTLRARLVGWARPRRDATPEVVEIDAPLVRRVGRRGVAMVERDDTPVVSDVDVSAVLVDLAGGAGPSRFSKATGVTYTTAKHLSEGRRPRAGTVRRIVASCVGADCSDAQAIARLADLVTNGVPACAFEGCASPARPKSPYCSPEHAAAARRAADRSSKRAARTKVQP